MQKIVFITGITSGFGYHIARLLNEKGHIVYGTYRTPPQNQISGVTYIQCDVTSDASVQNAIDQIIAEQQRLDVVINNAGMGFVGPLECTSIEELHAQMNVNFYGMVRVTLKTLPIFRKQEHGTFIFIGSIAGLIGLPYQGAYSASKFALEGYCQALYNEVKQYGIRVILVNPGDFHTNFSLNRQVVKNELCNKSYASFPRSLQIIHQNEANGLKPEVLAKKVEKIIRSKKPAYRYVIASPLQAVSVIARRLLPDSLMLKTISQYYKL